MSGKKEIPIIIPNKITQSKDCLSEDNIKFIHDVLDKSCVNDACISKSKLYAEVKKPLGLKIEKYQFEQAITNAIKNKKIPGFEIKRGAYGGICRLGYNVPKTISKKIKCSITLSNKKIITFMAVESKVIKLITDTFKAKAAVNGDGSLFVNNRAYKLPKDIDSEYILEFIVNNIKW